LARHSAARHPARRGLFSRFVGALLGLIIAAGVVVALQIPLLHSPANSYVALHVRLKTPASASLVWPSVGSAAIDIPSLGVQSEHHGAVVPIASLTKMMTAYVALQDLPLSIGETGPCHLVTADDLTTYNELVSQDASSVPVIVGEQLCEIDLLNGVLVHSAANYAVMLANMVAGSTEAFIDLMNEEAQTLGLTGTNYADVVGLSSDSVSTALDQARLAVLLMKSPLVRSIVIQTSVTLPYAGVEDSFTPDVGIDNVIGVKSGRTAAAGGCDVMAMTFQQGTTTRVVYAVVLGQEGGNLLTPAGEAALALANSAVASRQHYTLEAHRAYGEIAYDGHRVGFGLTSSHEYWWWPAQGTLHVHVTLSRETRSIHRGEVVGTLVVSGAVHKTLKLRAFGSLSPPTLLQRLR
jgi:D-alanyl-D-alanine carboxypeptidase (penicillin-binding protein 5/6)